MINILIPMAGSDEAFAKHGFLFPKPIIEIDGKPLIQHSLECLRSIEGARFIFVIRKEDDLRCHLREVLQLLAPESIVIRAEGPTAGAACTALLAIEHISNDEELVITNADQVFDCSTQEAIASLRERDLDAGCIVFDSVHPRWSFVKTDDNGLVVEAAEKRPLSRDATAGFYYFKRGRYFVEAAEGMIQKDANVGGGFFVCPTFNELILAQKRIGTFRIERDQYISLATPQSVEDYEQLLVSRKRRGTA